MAQGNRLRDEIKEQQQLVITKLESKGNISSQAIQDANQPIRHPRQEKNTEF
ncbi:8195_t:CDS:2 [Gigaspora rosea]|nr:8195_t:CDS:2 [Gigaspora rosea]